LIIQENISARRRLGTRDRLVSARIPALDRQTSTRNIVRNMRY
jgi:hypothetical protein